MKLPDYNPIPEIVDTLGLWSRSEFPLKSDQLINTLLNGEDLDSVKAQALVRALKERANELDLDCMEQTMFENELLWALPKPLEREIVLTAFPLEQLPEILKNYISEQAQSLQVKPEMLVLPILSTLAACIQGKYKVKDHHRDFDIELTLYTLTVAGSGEGKSPALNAATAPMYEYQDHWNEIHKLERKKRETEREYLLNRKAAYTKGKSADLNKAKAIDEELEKFPPMPEMLMSISDCTPEALAVIMQKHDEKMAILDDEGGVLGTIAGMYNNGNSNIDLLCHAWNGDRANVGRVSENRFLTHPLLTIGILTQYKKYHEFLKNRDFMDKGLLYRFLFSFPAEYGKRTCEVIPAAQSTKDGYNALVKRFMSFEQSKQPITHDAESKLLHRDFFDKLEDMRLKGGDFELIPEYITKMQSNVVKIAAILHLCEHSPAEPINGSTTQSAIKISEWLVEQAKKAFEGELGEDPTIATANKILKKLCNNFQSWYSLRDIGRLMHVPAKDEALIEAVDLLIDSYYLQSNGKAPAERGYKLQLNPIVRRYCGKKTPQRIITKPKIDPYSGADISGTW